MLPHYPVKAETLIIKHTKDGVPAVVMAITEQPHELELCKVRASHAAGGAVIVGRHL